MFKGAFFRLFVCVCAFALALPALCQQKAIDSLQKELKKYKQKPPTRQDTTRLKLWNALALAYYTVNSDSTIAIATRNRAICARLAYATGEGEAWRLVGLGYNQKGDFAQAIEHYQKSLDILEKAGEELAIAKALNSMGNTYKNQGDYPLALSTLRKGLKIREKHGDKVGASATLNNIGNIYYDQSEYKTAIDYYKQSIALKAEANDILGLPMVLNNIGGCYQKLGDYQNALAYLEKATTQSEKNGDKRVLAMSLHSIGEVHRKQDDFEQALQFYRKSTALKLVLKDKWGLMYDFFATAEVHAAQGRRDESIASAKRALDLAKEIKAPKEYKDICRLLYQNYKAEGQASQALLYFEAYKTTSDSLYNIDKAKAINNLEAKVALEKKEQQVRLLTLAGQKQAEANAFQRVILYLVLAVLAILAVFAFFVYRSRQAQRRLNVQLSDKTAQLQAANEELHRSRGELEHHNTQVKHSITTALAIQKALLPTDARVRRFLKDYFVFYQPRDIVSGDFYWIERVGKKIVVVAGDCTGHGVPGAFMSLIAINLLERVILQQNTLSPPQILENLHTAVREVLKQDEIDNQSGMDVAVVTLDEGGVLHFSGAKRPLYFIDASSPTEVQERKGSRKSIGGIQSEDKIFEEASLVLPAESVFYLSSDGLADQNNAKRKRLKDAPIFEVLLQNYAVSMEAQRDGLKGLLGAHMEGTEQRDDMMLLGIKI